MHPGPLVYSKPFLSINQQIERLKMRGMTIANEKTAKSWLKSVTYYRLSGYWYELRLPAPITSPRDPQDNFQPGTVFDDVISLYLFDEKLRFLILQAVSAIEVALRAHIVQVLAGRNPLAYMDQSIFNAMFTAGHPGKTKSNYDKWLAKIQTSIKRLEKEPFVEHFLNKYCSASDPNSWQSMPLWIMVDCWDFGLNRSYSKKIAKEFYAMPYPLLKSWLYTLTAARNFAAHHSRLWNRWWNVAVPKMPASADMEGLFSHIVLQSKSDPKLQKPTYMVLAIIKYFLIHTVEDKSKAWTLEIKSLLQQLPRVFGDAGKLGFPANWDKEALWNA